MRMAVTVFALLVLGVTGEVSARGRAISYPPSRAYASTSSTYSRSYSSTASNSSFFERGYNPGHIVGNSVRRVFLGPSMRP